MVAQGFNTVGYNSIHMDDCWEEKLPPRDPVTNKLRGDSKRFPSGMKARRYIYFILFKMSILLFTLLFGACLTPTHTHPLEV